MTNASKTSESAQKQLHNFVLELTTVPRDGRLLALILASKGIQDADERVIHQLLDFAYRECPSGPVQLYIAHGS